jgi:hypothetical protein
VEVLAVGVNNANFTTQNGPSTTIAITFTNNLTNPSLIVIGVIQPAPLFIDTVADTCGNSFSDTGNGEVQFSSSGVNMEMYSAKNTCTTASDVVTVTWDVSGSFTRMVGAEFTGQIAVLNAIDVINNAQNQTTSGSGANVMIVGSKTTTKNYDLMVATFADVDTAAPTPGTSPVAYIQATLASGLIMEYFLQQTAGSIGATAGDTASSDPYAGITTAFENYAGAISSSIVPRRVRDHGWH